MGARVHDETRSSRATPRSADVALAVLYFGELRFQQADDTRHEPALFFFFFLRTAELLALAQNFLPNFEAFEGSSFDRIVCPPRVLQLRHG